MIQLHGKLTVKRLQGLLNVGEGQPRGDLQGKTVTPSDTQIVVNPDREYYGLSHVTVNAVELQAKSVDPGTSVQIVEPDEGVVGLSSVTVDAAPLQLKTAQATTEPQTITPDAGFYGMAAVEVGAAPLQEAYVYPTSEIQVLEPEEDFIGFSKVTVDAAPDFPDGNYVEFGFADIPEPNGYGYLAAFKPKITVEPMREWTITIKGSQNITTTYSAESDVYVVRIYLESKDGPNKYISAYAISIGGPVKIKVVRVVTTPDGELYPPPFQIDDTFETEDFGEPGFFRLAISNDFDLSDYEHNFDDFTTIRVPESQCFPYVLATLSSKCILFASDSPIQCDGDFLSNVSATRMEGYYDNPYSEQRLRKYTRFYTGFIQVKDFELIWANHDVLDPDGATVYKKASDKTLSESLGITLDRKGDYLIEGDAINDLVAMAQKITGSDAPLTIEQATDALEKYYASGGTGGGVISATDDGQGNVTVHLTGGASVIDDGSGNVVIEQEG